MSVAGYVGKYHLKKEKKDYWYYVLTYGKNVKGKRIQNKKRGFKTKKEAEKALRDAQTTADRGTYVEPSKILYSEYLTDWFRGKSQNIGSQTAKNYESNIRVHIIPEIGNILLVKINALTIRKFLNNLKEDKGLSGGTIRKIFNLINSSLYSAESMQLVMRNEAKFVEKPKPKRKDMKIWNSEEARRFLNFVKATDTRHYIIFHLALATGMRQGEILGLRWSDIDFDRQTISISQTLSHDGKELLAGAKTQSGIRSIAIDIQTKIELELHRELIKGEKSALGSYYSDFDLVTATNSGQPYSPRSLDKIWNKLRDSSELKKIRYHDLRHTHASLLLSANVHPKVVSERLGHS